MQRNSQYFLVFAQKQCRERENSLLGAGGTRPDLEIVLLAAMKLALWKDSGSAADMAVLHEHGALPLLSRIAAPCMGETNNWSVELQLNAMFWCVRI